MRLTSAEPQVGHWTMRCFFCPANSSAEANQPSKRCPDAQSRSKTIICAFYNGGVSPLVFLHGVGGRKAAWDRQVEHFGALGYRCIAWDQPGYGQSPIVEPYTFERLAAALNDQGGEKAVIRGTSLGGLP